MQLYKIVFYTLLCCFNMLFLCSCNGSHEIDDWVYPNSIGIDKGSEDQLRFTFQSPTLRKGNVSQDSRNSQSQGSSEYLVTTLDSATFFAGVNVINISMSRTLNFTHTKYIIISEDLAKEGVGRFINGMIRSSQIRRMTHIIIVKGSASDFIKEFNPRLGTSISKTQELLMDQEKESGFFDNVNYNQFFIGLKNGYSQPTASFAALNDFSNTKIKGAPPEEFKSPGEYYAGELPRTSGNKFEIFGTAIFDGDKMVGKLNGDETRALLMLKGEYKKGSIVVADPLDKKLRITAMIQSRKKPKVKVTFKNGEPIIDVKLSLEGDLQNLQSSTEYEDPKHKPVLEAAFKKFLKSDLDNTINKCKNLNCKVFRFGETAAMSFSTIKEWEKYNWLSHFKNAQVTTSVDFVIRRSGTLTKTSETQNIEGKKK